MEKRGLVIGIFISIFFISFILFQTNFAVSQTQIINEEYLDNLKLQANVECLQNSQCSESYSCIDNSCINNNEIDICKKVSLSTNGKQLKVGSSINSAKKVLTRGDLPYLLSDGEIVEVIGGNLTTYLYSPSLLVGQQIIEQEISNYAIKNIDNSNPIYTLRFDFSKVVDFSNENIQGQVLRILGEEYIIGSDSTNSVINLISDNKNIKLQDEKKIKTGFLSSAEGTYVNLKKNDEGNIFGFSINFFLEDTNKNKIGVAENHIGKGFDAIKLSFDLVDLNGLAEISIGGNC